MSVSSPDANSGFTTISFYWIVHPTERGDSILDALRSIFPDIDATPDGHGLKGGVRMSAVSHDLDAFLGYLERYRIRDTARELLLKVEMERNGLFSYPLVISKQAAFGGRINFVTGDEGPLGDVHVDICVKDREHLMNSLTPPVIRDEIRVRRLDR